jgi:GTP pyrophosphokinase
MAKVASVLAAAEVDIVHIHSGEDGAQETKDFYFVIAVRDRAHLDTVLAKLRRTSVVIRADRSKNSVTQAITSP